MPTLNAALNFNFASEQAARLAYAERGAEEVVAAQLRQAAAEQNTFKVGATITARYQYKVAEDGSFIPVQTQITADAPNENGGNSRRNPRSLRQNDSERPPKFSDLIFPRPTLSPSDEISIFARAVLNEGVAKPTASALPPVASSVASNTAAVITAAEAVDEDGAPVQAEIITPQAARSGPNPLDFSPRAQFSVASLYARNSDLVYNVTPITRLAA